MLIPWKETRVIDEKIQMIDNCLIGEYSLNELSKIYDVSRKTLYKWLNRYRDEGNLGLQDRSRMPLRMSGDIHKYSLLRHNEGVDNILSLNLLTFSLLPLPLVYSYSVI